jgi:hypothetical protein
MHLASVSDYILLDISWGLLRDLNFINKSIIIIIIVIIMLNFLTII